MLSGRTSDRALLGASALLFAGRQRDKGVLLAATVVIPVGDMLLVLARKGLSCPGHLLLHGLSGGCCAAVALWLLRQEPDPAG